MPEEVTFQNDPIDPAVEFRKQHNHFFVAERAEDLDADRASGEVLWRLLVRDGARPRLAEPAQHTGELDWDATREWRPGAT